MDYAIVKECAVSGITLSCGLCLLCSEKTALVGKLMTYFGAQTGMNIYMKAVLSSSVVSEEKGMKGIPAAFAVTALQQFVGFVTFALFLLIAKLVGKGYPIKKVQGKQWIGVFLFSFAFAFNIALNNFSISLVAISINLVIRSCLPLSTFISQQALSRITSSTAASKDADPRELLCMVLGVVCAAVAVVAKAESKGQSSESSHLMLGVTVCVVSTFSGAINLALAGFLGEEVKLNPLDTTVYMSIPVITFLIIPIFLISHPVPWKGAYNMTDWQIFTEVCRLSPITVMYACISGVLALAYNTLQFSIVQTLSATHATFAGNFNKAATIVLGVMIGLEHIPAGYWGVVMTIAVICNILCFTVYNIIKTRNRQRDAGGAYTRTPLNEDSRKVEAIETEPNGCLWACASKGTRR